MSKMAELDYDIEQLYIEGLSNKAIAAELQIPEKMVRAWVDSNIGCEQIEFEPDENPNDFDMDYTL